MANVELAKSVSRYLDNKKKCSPPLREEFIQRILLIPDDIEVGIPLVGNLSGCYKIPFDYKRVSYRIVYEVFENMERAVVVYCGPRGNAYDRVKRKLRRR
ncbi:MAG: hypothetical protein FH756_15430 [Firmicutes bacterium]|nr:hypothetical protein [Bacillota bacterium]